MGCTKTRIFKKSGRPKGPEKIMMRGKYSRNGCVPCRRQKKKCDEGRPECDNCARKQRQCWYAIGNDCEVPGALVPEESSKWLEDTESQSITAPLAEKSTAAGLALTPTFLLSTTEKMFLDSLLENPLMAIELAHSSPEIPRNVYEEQKLDLLASCTLNAMKIPKKESELLCYFIDEVSMLLFVDKTTTRFLGTVIPLCLEDPRVRYPIIAIASSHRVNNSNNEDGEIMRDAVKYRGMAQCCLACENGDFFADTENVLLSICLVSIQEIFEGNSLYWSSALEKGSEVIRVRGGLSKVSSISPLSIQLFCYLDHVSSLSTCATPHLDRPKYNPYLNYDGNHVEDILNCKFGFRYGVAGELFKIMGNISTLAGLRSNRHKSLAHEQQFDSLANLIEMKLQNWSPSPLELTDNFLINGIVDIDKFSLSSYWLALQWSSFLRLHQIREGYNRQDTRVSACLSIILRSLKSIESIPEIETGLMFPLIMAGVVSTAKEDREYILSRIRSIKDKLRFNYIGEFEKLLHAVWESGEKEGDSINWAKIRFYQFPGLVMF